MRRDIILGSLAVIVSSFLVFNSFFTASKAYKGFEISPLVYKPTLEPIDTTKQVKGTMHLEPNQEPTTYEPKYKVSIDPPTFKDSFTLETYMELPLETEGKTFETSGLYNDLEEEVPIEDPVFIKYVRFQCTAVRGSEKTTVHIGGFKFLQGKLAASSKQIHIWNPHTGESRLYTGGAWSDSDQQIVIFRFSEPVLITRYILQSSTESADFDPIHWKIDGSMSGTFWSPLDDRVDSETAFPIERKRHTVYNMKF